MSLSRINNRKIKAHRYYIYILTLAIIFFGFWASYFQIDMNVRARGQIIAAQKTQVLQSPDSGVIDSITVKEGDTVEKGQILLTLEKERAQAAFDGVEGKVAALKITLVRLEAEVYEKELKFPEDLLKHKEFIDNQKELYLRRKEVLTEDLDTLKQSLKLATEELQMNMPLLKSGDVSKAEVLKLKRQITEINGQITSKKNKFFQDAQAEMTKTQEELSTQDQNLLDKKQLLEYTVMSSPVKGIVKKVNISTKGGVVKPGEELVEILPIESDLIIEAKIQPLDMSNLKKGLVAYIKLDAYDYSIYGSMKGEVEYISPDALMEQTKGGENIYYKVKIRIKQDEFKDKLNKNIQIDPGMTVGVDIKTGQRTVLTYLLKPIIKTLNESLNEK